MQNMSQTEEEVAIKTTNANNSTQAATAHDDTKGDLDDIDRLSDDEDVKYKFSRNVQHRLHYGNLKVFCPKKNGDGYHAYIGPDCKSASLSLGFFTSFLFILIIGSYFALMYAYGHFYPTYLILSTTLVFFLSLGVLTKIFLQDPGMAGKIRMEFEYPLTEKQTQ